MHLATEPNGVFLRSITRYCFTPLCFIPVLFTSFGRWQMAENFSEPRGADSFIEEDTDTGTGNTGALTSRDGRCEGGTDMGLNVYGEDMLVVDHNGGRSGIERCPNGSYHRYEEVQCANEYVPIIGANGCLPSEVEQRACSGGMVCYWDGWSWGPSCLAPCMSDDDCAPCRRGLSQSECGDQNIVRMGCRIHWRAFSFFNSASELLWTVVKEIGMTRDGSNRNSVFSITNDELSDLASTKIVRPGIGYAKARRVTDIVEGDDRLEERVVGTEKEPYLVSLEFDDDEILHLPL